MRILLVEDEPTLSDQISAALIESGFVIDHAGNGQDALHLGTEESYDAIILDLGLPIMDGMTVLKNWRAKGLTTPVLILTARDSWHDKVSGIDAGADDYLSKPFHMQELLARVRALIRRASGIASSTLRCGSVMLDTTSGRVTVDSQNVGLTAHELKVLSFLMHHQDEIISRTTLTEHIYAQDFDRDSNTIDVFIGRLRKKIPENMIETVRGLGYRMRASP
jgi:two-component system OmpR family response regulator